MATFTWTATIAGGNTAWETTAAWLDSSSPSTTPAFTTAPGDDYIINGSNLFTIGEIGAGGSAAPDIANSIALNDFQAVLNLYDPALITAGGRGTLEVTSTLTLDGLLNLGTAYGGGLLAMGSAGGGGGTINLGSTGRLEGALGDSISDQGSTPTQITGPGTVIAEGGIFQVGTSVQVASGAATKFQIDPNATLSFADAVGGGTIVFSTASGSGALDVAALSSFNAAVKSLYIAHGENNISSYVDFLNVGTTASATLSNVNASSATLNIFPSSGGSHSITILGNFSAPNLNVNFVSDGNGGTNVFLTDTPCYAAGTLILTPDGEVPVETIAPGAVVLTVEAGDLVPRSVIWTGLREVDLARHPRPRSVAPIRFRAGALGDGLPRRDLLLSPDHCLLLDGGLIPARLLVNGSTIVRDLSMASVTYHHIELARHGVLLAEGVEAESYLDTGNRAYFSNAGLTALTHPGFGVNYHLRRWETDACAPLRSRPDEVRPIWQRLVDRAHTLGLQPPPTPTTVDPGLRLLVDGKTLRPLAQAGDTVRFAVPGAAASIRLVSRRAAGDPRPWLDDPRDLGVAVRALTVRDRAGEKVLSPDHPGFTDGWHAPESSPDGATWRWTEGDAALPIVWTGACLLELIVSRGTRYLADEARAAA